MFPPLPKPPAVAEISLLFLSLMSWAVMEILPPSPASVVAVIVPVLSRLRESALMIKFPALPIPSWLTLTLPPLLTLKELVLITIFPDAPLGRSGN